MKHFLLLCGSIMLYTASLSAQTTWDCGASGNNVTATLSGDTLTISGIGDMANFKGDSPWYYNGNRTSIKSVIIGDGVTSIGDWAFLNCSNLTSIDIPNSIKSIGVYTFSGCTRLSSVTIPNSVASIGKYAFNGCNNLISVDIIPNSVADIGNNVNSMGIGEYAFNGCSRLSSVTIPESVASIAKYAFSNCRSLTSLDIPNSIASIGEYAFFGCANLKSITIHAETPPTLGNNVFSCPKDIPVHIPCLAYNPYPAAWNYFTNFIKGGTPDTTYYNAVKCYGKPYTDPNFTGLNKVGVYYATLDNANHCDSIVCLTLSEYPPVSSTYQAAICQGSSYSDANFTDITTAGTYQVTLQNVNGCDSIVYLQLSYFNTPMQELCMISVDNNYHNQIVWKRQEEITAYNIYREGNIAGQYELVQTIPYENENSWIDTENDARVRPHSYKISAIDTCSNESGLSAPHKTMHLLINQGVGGSWNLIWTPYEGIEYSTYNIYRAVGDSELTLISSVPGSLTSFTDFTSTGNDYVYYMVEIVLYNTCEISASQRTLQLKSASASSFGSIRSNIATNNPNGITDIVETLQTISPLQVYPNPTNGIVHIATESNLHIKVYNIHGVLLQNVFGNKVDLSDYPQSMYLLQVGEKWVKVMKK